MTPIDAHAPGDDDPAGNQFRFLWLTGTWPATFRALRHRNFRLFWFGQLISLIGTWMQSVAQGWLVRDLTLGQSHSAHTAYALGIVSAIGSAPMLLLSPFAGVIADHHDKRRILLATQTAAMLLALGLATLSWLGLITLWQVGLFALALGIVNAFDMPTRQSYIKEMVGQDDLLNAIALNSSIFNGARIIGPAMAGWLIAIPAMGVAGTFFVNGISYLAVIASLAAINTIFLPPQRGDASVLQRLWEGVRYTWCHSTIRLLMLLMAVYSIFGFPYIILMPVIAGEELHVGVVGYAMLVAAGGVGALTGALLLASLADRIRKGKLLLAGGIIFTLGLLGFSLSHTYPLSLFLTTLIGGGLVIVSASINSLIQETVPDALRGRVISLWTVIFAGFMPVGSLYAGIVAGLTNPMVPLLISSIVSGMTLLFITWRYSWLWRVE